MVVWVSLFVTPLVLLWRWFFRKAGPLNPMETVCSIESVSLQSEEACRARERMQQFWLPNLQKRPLSAPMDPLLASAASAAPFALDSVVSWSGAPDATAQSTECLVEPLAPTTSVLLHEPDTASNVLPDNTNQKRVLGELKIRAVKKPWSPTTVRSRIDANAVDGWFRSHHPPHHFNHPNLTRITRYIGKSLLVRMRRTLLSVMSLPSISSKARTPAS
jgi:hypothetical protein